MDKKQPIQLSQWRRFLALAVLVGGLGWVIGSFWQSRRQSHADLNVALARGLRPAEVELWICLRDAQGEDVWSFRGRLASSRRRFQPQVPRGEYELHAAVRAGGRDLPSARLRLKVPGNPVQVEISETEARILH